MKLLKLGREATDDKTLKLFYASDVHGSGICWRKFVGAGRFYGADCLVMGGDLTGKAIVPVERDALGHFSVRVPARTSRGFRVREAWIAARRDPVRRALSVGRES